MRDTVEMVGLKVGCVGFRGPKARYFERMGAWELAPTEMNAKPGTQARWVEDAGPGAYVPRVDPAVAEALFKGEAAEAGWARTVEAAERLQADTVLLRTPATFRPTPQNKAALQAFFAGRPGPTVAWWADGLWDGMLEDTAALAQAAGVLPVVDPLGLDDDEVPPAGPRIYWRVRGGQGMQGKLSDYDLDRLADMVQGRVGGHVVFAAPEMWGDAGRFASLLEMLGGDDSDEAFEE
ncbi:MAG: hypothetical protein H6702_13785 [Myxococcales bacterium]|nr:hypothetical protein [Myxococcales bacterium]